MSFNDMLRHGKADAGPLDVSCFGSGAANKFLEYFFLLRSRNPDSPVPDADGQAALFSRHLDPDCAAVRRIFDRIVEQVPQRQAEGFAIGVNERMFPGDLEFYLVALRRGLLLELGDDVVH